MIYDLHNRVVTQSFNLVIEILLVPTQNPNILHVGVTAFQSRNRDTFSSYFEHQDVVNKRIEGFNLVIEILLVPTYRGVTRDKQVAIVSIS